MNKLYHQHRIAIRTEAVVFLQGDLVGVHDLVESAESRHCHEHRGLRHMEARDDGVGNGELVRREYELVCPSVEGLDLMGCRDISLKTPHHCRADGDDLVAAVFGLVDDLASLVGDYEPLGIHAVFGQILDIDPAELSDPHVDGDEGLVYILEDHPVEQLPTEMGSSGGHRHRTLMGGEDRLVVLLVLRGHLALDPLRDRQLAESEE